MAKTALLNLLPSAYDTACEHVAKIVDLLTPQFPGEQVAAEVIKSDSSHQFPPAFIEIEVGLNKARVRVEADYESPRYRAGRGPEDYKLLGYTMIPLDERKARSVLKKDGTFSYDRIADALGARVRRDRDVAQRIATKTAHRGENLDFIMEFNKCAQPDLGSIEATDRDGPPLRVSIQFKAYCEGAAAVELGKLLRDWHSKHDIG